MKVAVTGSVATDYLMRFRGRFAEQVMPDQIHRLSLSFLVDDLQVRRGGVAANITFGMAQLGLRPILVAAVGHDFDEYRAWLDRHGVDTDSVKVSESHHTARFFCTTDDEQNQIASFYPGAMSEASMIELSPVAERVSGLDLVVVSPNDPAAMLRHTDDARTHGLRFMADPSQQLAVLEGPQIEELVTGARFLVGNDYEMALIESKTGWSHADVLARVDSCITTRGAKGSVIETEGAALSVPAVPVADEVDPTGVGDAFRAGLLAALAWGLELERGAQVGSTLAALVLETVGPQEYDIEPAAFAARFEASYGPVARQDLPIGR